MKENLKPRDVIENAHGVCFVIKEVIENKVIVVTPRGELIELDYSKLQNGYRLREGYPFPIGCNEAQFEIMATRNEKIGKELRSLITTAEWEGYRKVIRIKKLIAELETN